MDWNNAEAVYLSEQADELDSLTLEVSRLNIKKYVDHVFWENNRLIVIVYLFDQWLASMKWFQSIGLSPFHQETQAGCIF